ncbi:MAG: hypothetical protein QM773_01880 [Hyphomonadaceae bacterium]
MKVADELEFEREFELHVGRTLAFGASEVHHQLGHRVIAGIAFDALERVTDIARFTGRASRSPGSAAFGAVFTTTAAMFATGCSSRLFFLGLAMSRSLGAMLASGRCCGRSPAAQQHHRRGSAAANHKNGRQNDKEDERLARHLLLGWRALFTLGSGFIRFGLLGLLRLFLLGHRRRPLMGITRPRTSGARGQIRPPMVKDWF